MDAPPEQGTDPARILTIKLDGDAVEDGRVTFATLAGKLDAAQATVFNLALSKNKGPIAARGSWNKNIRAACELFFVASKGGSLTVVSEIASDQLPLPGMLDLGPEVLSDLHLVVDALVRGDENKLLEIMPDTVARSRTLKSLQNLCPRPGENLTVQLGNGVGGYYGTLTENTRSTIANFFRVSPQYSEVETQTIVGELVEIRVKAGSRHIVIFSDQREIECLFSSEMEETISQLIAGSVVEAEGRVQLTAEGKVKQMDEIYDISTVDLSPYTQRTFSWGGRRYQLREPVLCQISYQGGWIYECPRYGLHAFSKDRTEAVFHLNEEFAFLYDGLVDEPDNALTIDAINLRDRLRYDVISILAL